MAGRPSKKPKLVRHGARPNAQNSEAQRVQRHRVFSQQPSGGFALWTSYITAFESSAVQEIPEPPTISDSHVDPWDEIPYDQPTIQCDDTPTVKSKQRQKTPGPVYRCKDCFTLDFFCQDCIVRSHINQPFHRVESLGLRIQLGHRPGEACPNREAAFDDDFVIIDAQSIHMVALDFCVNDPRTTATFSVMELFHILSFESKVTAFEFFHMIVQRTDNTGLTPIRKYRYAVFLRMVSEWHNIKALQRSGRRHDPAGIDATQEGDLAILCPACPQPGKNLPPNWEQSERQWLYALFVAIDANFRLKRRHVSSELKDPGLSQGWGYFIKDNKYKAYLKANAGVIQERSTCVSHNTVNMADTKSSKGLSVTGVGAVVCACHDMKLPCSVGDLQKDMSTWTTSSSLAGSTFKSINVSYDIACQWYKKVWTHMKSLPANLQIDPTIKRTNFFVPKFHLATHVDTCQTQFSFNWTPGVGRTDGEAPERGWANINHLIAAIKGRAVHHEALQELEGSIEAMVEGKMELEKWTCEIEAWEADKSKPNPMESKVTLTLSSVRLQLAEQDACDLETGKDHGARSRALPVSSPCMCLSATLTTDWTRLGQHATEDQKSKLLLRCNALQREIDSWITIQSLYIPNTSSIRSTGLDSSQKEAAGTSRVGITERPEDVPLLLLMLEVEWALRYAQASDALNECRHHIQLRAQFLKFKDRNLAQRTVQAVQDRLSLSHSKYNCAHTALTSLAPKLEKLHWQDKFQPLKTTDLRAMGDLLEGQTQGTAIMSWIWLTQGIPTNEDAGLQDTLRIEWTKARARYRRWDEEVHFLLEKICRILTFLEWEAEWWDQRAVLRRFKKSEDMEAFTAYAKRQAAIRRKLNTSFAANWVHVEDEGEQDEGDD
ncbi:hypothetical protein L210DRAFT_3614605 [Boletus edulis BED1]|uniref:CxC2-like cysteine cluster KDZ transposase-associated domain-containing protein n=1 Tax=Boletus edulis BED1 TaxID=1328754 RepID=A0AAD4BHL7_BOLED|nr:hypothetical protein L210DRAFT_3614605 [Boletus edulis BED1]